MPRRGGGAFSSRKKSLSLLSREEVLQKYRVIVVTCPDKRGASCMITYGSCKASECPKVFRVPS
ncbi:MAG: hypothetical protein WED05_04560 [Candidatus Atabeyarchaeum deiterrae]